MQNARLHIATLVAAHGVSGQAKLKVFLDNAQDIARYGPLQDCGGRIYHLKAQEFKKGMLTVRIQGLDTRNKVEAAKGLKLYIAKDQLPTLEEDEYYSHQLEGLDVFLENKALYGTVIKLCDFGAGELLEIKRSQDEKPELIPFTKKSVPYIDLEDKKLVIRPLVYKD